jgi:hypothetical protein
VVLSTENCAHHVVAVQTRPWPIRMHIVTRASLPSLTSGVPHSLGSENLPIPCFSHRASLTYGQRSKKFNLAIDSFHPPTWDLTLRRFQFQFSSNSFPTSLVSSMTLFFVLIQCILALAAACLASSMAFSASRAPLTASTMSCPSCNKGSARIT